MMCGFCFGVRLISVKNKSNSSVLINLSEKNRGMNKETGIRKCILFGSDSVWVKKLRNWWY